MLGWGEPEKHVPPLRWSIAAASPSWIGAMMVARWSCSFSAPASIPAIAEASTSYRSGQDAAARSSSTPPSPTFSGDQWPSTVDWEGHPLRLVGWCSYREDERCSGEKHEQAAPLFPFFHSAFGSLLENVRSCYEHTTHNQILYLDRC